jgi:hypothetical protein
MTPAINVRILIEVTARPLIDGGTISARYKGAVADAMPVTKEFQNRPHTKAPKFGAKSCKKTPPIDKQ